MLFVSVVNGCVSVSAFASLVGISVGIARSAVRLNICAITAGTKRYKSIIKKKKKNSLSSIQHFFVLMIFEMLSLK